MLIPARKVLWLCLFVFSQHSAMAASDAPNGYLKGIKVISYDLGVEKTVGGNQCSIDQDNLNTSIEFVANQSTKLKIVPPDQKMKRTNELMGEALSGSDKEAANKAFRDYNFMPSFYIGIQPLQATQFICAGTVNAELWVHVDVEDGHVIPTQAVMSYPATVIRSTTVGFVYPQQTFSNQVINITEQIMKQLVNDWAAAQ
jgi:hypothetical protein